MPNIDSAAVIQYQSQFETALQQKGSKLRPFVYEESVQGESTRFDVVGESNVQEDRPLGQVIEFDSDNPITNSLAEMKPYEAARLINKLQEFELKAPIRQKFADANAMALARIMDKVILNGMKASNTSAGAAAPFDMALLSTVSELTETYDWETDDRTLVITPRVYNKLMQINQYGSADFNKGAPLVNGRATSFMGWNIVVSSLLQSSTYWTNSTTHNCYAFASHAVGLGVSQDIKSEVEWRPDLRAWQAIADMKIGAATILPKGVLKVTVNGL